MHFLTKLAGPHGGGYLLLAVVPFALGIFAAATWLLIATAMTIHDIGSGWVW